MFFLADSEQQLVWKTGDITLKKIKNLKFNNLNFMVWSLVSGSIQPGKPLGTGREKWLLIGRNFIYIMTFHFDFSKVQSTSAQFSLSGQRCHTSKCAELHIDLLGTAHSSPSCFPEVRGLHSPLQDLQPGSVMLAPQIFQMSWSCILYIKRKKKIRNKIPNLSLQSSSSVLLFGVTEMQWDGPRPRSTMGCEIIMTENTCRLH